MTKKKLIVRFKEGNLPSEQMNFMSTGQPVFKRLHDIDNEVKSFKSSNAASIINYASDSDLFNHEIYAAKDEAEKKLYRTFEVECSSEEEAAALAKSLKASKKVEYIQTDERNELYYKPNDPMMGNLWGLAKIDCANAWSDSEGQNVVVGVLDTGVDYNHPDISGNMWRDANGNFGYDFSDDKSDPKDYHGHGTHVAGTIAAVGNNNIGIIGVAPKAKIMAVKIFPNADDSVCAKAIRYAVDNGAKVLNNSWGPTGRRPSNPAVEDAIDYALVKGCTVVFAAGNNNDDVKYYSPSNHPKVISVGATDINDQRASFSNYGAGVTVAAPGVNILSLQRNGSGYISMQGTSMAAPHVVGLATLILKVNSQLKPDEVKTIIEKNTDKITPDRLVGSGRINALKSISALRVEKKKISIASKKKIKR